MTIHSTDIAQWERFYRANFINSLTAYKPAVLIGTQNREGAHNLAMFSNVFHLGADPALIGYIQRPVGQSGHTYMNIKETGCYTMNLVHEEIAEQAHYSSARFEKGVSEFEETNLTPEFIDDFKAPFVKESPIKFGLEFIQEIPIELNNTILVIGKINLVQIAENLIETDGNIDAAKAKIVATLGLEKYMQVHNFVKLPYANVKGK